MSTLMNAIGPDGKTEVQIRCDAAGNLLVSSGGAASSSGGATEATLQAILQALTVGSLTTAFTVQNIANGTTLQFTPALQGIAVGSTYVFAVTGAPAGVVVTASTNGTANVISVSVQNTTGTNITTPFSINISATKN